MSQCQGELQHIGEEVSERLEYVPASLYVIEEACQKYACGKGCTVVTAQKPMQPIEKGLPGPGLLAHVASASMRSSSVVPSGGITSAKEWRIRKPCATGCGGAPSLSVRFSSG